MSELNLFQRLLAVQADIDRVEKGGTNETQGYAFVRASDVASAVRKAMIAHGVYCSTSITSTQDVRVIDRPNKSPILYAELNGEMTFINVDDPKDQLTVGIAGHGMAYGEDKGIYKAITGAIKYGLRTAFLIPDDSDPEAEKPAISSGFISALPLTRKDVGLPFPDHAGMSVDEVPLIGQKPVSRPETPKLASMATDRQKALLRAKGREVGLEGDAFKAFVAMTTGKTTSKDLEIGDVDRVLLKFADKELVEQFATATYGETA
jgi:hypothetical protein